MDFTTTAGCHTGMYEEVMSFSYGFCFPYNSRFQLGTLPHMHSCTFSFDKGYCAGCLQAGALKGLRLSHFCQLHCTALHGFPTERLPSFMLGFGMNMSFNVSLVCTKTNCIEKLMTQYLPSQA